MTYEKVMKVIIDMEEKKDFNNDRIENDPKKFGVIIKRNDDQHNITKQIILEHDSATKPPPISIYAINL